MPNLSTLTLWGFLAFFLLRVAESYAIVYTKSKKDDTFLGKVNATAKEFFRFG